MVLVDYQIMSLCEKGMITPYEPTLVNPASLDVRIGGMLIVETEYGWKNFDISNLSERDPFMLCPGEFLLAQTLETFNMPENIAGELKLKSSRAREGYDNALAVWLDPGWCGSVLTLELKNNCLHHHLPLYPGLKIGQIIFHQCNQPIASYKTTGRYNGDATAQMSKG